MMRPQSQDWAPLIVLAVAVSIALTGAGFLGGYAVGYAQHKPVADRANANASATAAQSEPKPTPATDGSPQCSFADFPVYPGSDTYRISPPMQNAWFVNQLPSQVASYYARGAYQRVWTFVAGPNATVTPGNPAPVYTFRFTRAPACRGELTVSPYSRAGATVYQALPDAP